MEHGITLTLHPEKRQGYLIPTDVYEEVKTFIMSSFNKNDEVLLKDLIDVAQHRRLLPSGNNIAWYVLIVKLDLEARGLISCFITVGYERNQVLKIKKKRSGKAKRNIYI